MCATLVKVLLQLAEVKRSDSVRMVGYPSIGDTAGVQYQRPRRNVTLLAGGTESAPNNQTKLCKVLTLITLVLDEGQGTCGQVFLRDVQCAFPISLRLSGLLGIRL